MKKISSKSRSKWKCLDCDVDTGKIGEHYFVHDHIWFSVVNSQKGMLCVGCIEKRLGRKLNKNDFPKVIINNPKFESKSSRLMDRIKS